MRIRENLLHHVLAFATITAGLLCVDGAVNQANAQSMSVAPTRVVFEGRERSTQLHLHNGGDEAVTYRLGLKRARMDEDGRMSFVDGEAQEGERFADELIRFSPRQVTVGPGETQRVRLMARTSADLEEGEYRSHLRFEALPMVADASDSDGEGDDFQVQVKMRQNLVIPVIVRHGESQGDVDFEAAISGNEENRDLELSLQRRGNRSSYGDVEVGFTGEDSGERHVVTRRRGVSVYLPNDVRRMSLAFVLPDELQGKEGRFDVTYQEMRGDEARGEPLRKILEQ